MKRMWVGLGVAASLLVAGVVAAQPYGMMAGVLRGIRKTNLMDPFPRVKAYYERCLARPAWQRTLSLYAERLGISVDAIR